MTVSNYGRHGKRVTKAYHVFFLTGTTIGTQASPLVNRCQKNQLCELLYAG